MNIFQWKSDIRKVGRFLLLFLMISLSNKRVSRGILNMNSKISN